MSYVMPSHSDNVLEFASEFHYKLEQFDIIIECLFTYCYLEVRYSQMLDVPEMHTRMSHIETSPVSCIMAGE